MPFIVGVGRSGTTLLRLMLDSHRDIAIPPETGFIPSLLDLRENDQNAVQDLFLNTLTGDARWNDFKISREDMKDAIASIKPFSAPEGIRSFYKLYAKRFNKTRYGDKTPAYVSSMRMIGEALPEARFIHLIRDGRDVALSLKRTWFSPGDSMEDLARYWSERIVEARKQAKDISYYLEIRYEDLIWDTRDQLKKICDFIQLPFDEQMESYYKRSRSRLDEVCDVAENARVITKEQRLAQHPLISFPPDKSRIGVYKHEMHLEEIRRFESIAGKLMSDLGYEK